MTGAGNIDIIGVPFNSSGLSDGVARAPDALRAAGLIDAIRRTGVVVEDRGDIIPPGSSAERDPSSHVIAPARLVAMIRDVRSRVGESLARGAFPVVIGGDCPILLGCLAALVDRDGSTGLVFVDGHDDAWPPERSPSGEAADMELGFLLGLTDGDLPKGLSEAFPRLAFDDVVVLGPRDEAELRAAGVATLEGLVHYRTSAEVSADPSAASREAVASMAGRRGWWFHVDLDVLSTASLSAVDYPQPGGLDWVTLGQLSAAALTAPGVAGWDITIYNPDRDRDGSGAARIITYIAEALTGRAR